MRILCFGDSNTYGYDPRSFFGGRYPPDARWVDLLASKTGWDVVNGGENGREIPSKEGELARFDDLLSRTGPELVVVMLGGNDLLQGLNADGAAERMERFLRHIPILPEQILLVAPPPMKWGAWVTEASLLAESDSLVGRYARVAQRYGVPCADASEWGVTLAYDGVHFDEAGHQRFAEGLFKVLSERM